MYDFINENSLSKLDILKIDTEGYELEVLKGLKDKIKIVNYVYFEHHYDFVNAQLKSATPQHIIHVV